LSKVLGREIIHVKLTGLEYTNHLVSIGIPLEDARFFASMDADIENGKEDRMNSVVEEVTGQAPESFWDFVRAHKSCWV
jgi:hypothetical protein